MKFPITEQESAEFLEKLDVLLAALDTAGATIEEILEMLRNRLMLVDGEIDARIAEKMRRIDSCIFWIHVSQYRNRNNTERTVVLDNANRMTRLERSTQNL